MNVFLTMALCFLPLIVLIFVCKFTVGVQFFYIFLSSFLGLLAVLPILFIQLFIGDIYFFRAAGFLPALIRSLVFNGLVEELLKAAVIFILPARKMTLKAVLACAMLVGLSLGCFESSVYFLRNLRSSASTIMYGQIFLRMATADLVHLTCTALSGIFVWSLWRKSYAIFALLVAVFAHGIYNFFAMYTTGIRYFAIAAIFFAAAECRVQYLRVKEIDSQNFSTMPL